MSHSYTVRVHPRARHVRLRLDPREGLIVTVPPRFDQRRIPAMLAERADWIETVAQRHASLRADCAPALLGSRPRRVELAAIDRAWAVSYRPTDRVSGRLSEQKDSLLIELPDADEPEQDRRVTKLLRAWLVKHSRAALGRELDALAREHGLAYQDFSIRFQRSRWGSCSARGRISLNARLMFCPPAAMRYVLVHELAHTRHLNHSPAFWALVADMMPDYAVAQRQLKQAWQRLPDWA